MKIKLSILVVIFLLFIGMQVSYGNEQKEKIILKENSVVLLDLQMDEDGDPVDDKNDERPKRASSTKLSSGINEFLWGAMTWIRAMIGGVISIDTGVETMDSGDPDDVEPPSPQRPK